jgi:hypothetical protein
MIRHTVVFRLHHREGSAEEAAFLRSAARLADIPGVQRFEQLRQVGDQSGYRFSFSMEFDDQDGYDAYSAHPTHVDFVQTRWVPEVAHFLELDFVPL